MKNHTFKTIKKYLQNKSFISGVIVLLGGTAGAQALLLIASPLLSRIYSPSAFGELAVFMSLTTIGASFCTLRYEQAIAIPENIEDSKKLTLIAISLAGIISCAILTSTLMLTNEISQILKISPLTLYAIPLGVFIAGTIQSLTAFTIRKKHFSTAAYSKVKQSITTILIQVSLFKIGTHALIFGQMIGQGIGILSLTKSFNSSSSGVKKSTALELVSRFRKFPLYSTFGAVANSIGSQLPPIMLIALFSPHAAGLYALANRVLAGPMAIIGQAIGGAFQANAAEKNREGNLGDLVDSITNRLAMISAIPTALLILFAPDIFQFIFGTEWRESGVMAQWMAPWLFFVFISSPISTIYEITERQGFGAAYNILLLALRAIALLYGYQNNSLIVAIIAFSITSAAMWAAFYAWTLYITKMNVIKCSLRSIFPTIAFTISLMPIWIYNSQPEDTNLCIAAYSTSSILIAMCIYFTIKLNKGLQNASKR